MVLSQRYRPTSFGLLLMGLAVAAVSVFLCGGGAPQAPMFDLNSGHRAEPRSRFGAVPDGQPVIDTPRSSGDQVRSPREPVVREVGCRVPAKVAVADFDREDARRLRRVNAILINRGFPPIAADAEILVGDLQAFRGFVDDAVEQVRLAESNYYDASDAALDPLRSELKRRLASGATSDLPLVGPENPAKRRERHEAISQVSYEGRNFVLRASPTTHRGLRDAGQSYDESREQEALTFQELVAPLFR